MYRVRINGCGTVFCEPAWQWDPPPAQFNDFDLWFVWAGVGTLSIDGQVVPVHRGKCCLLRPGLACHGRHDRMRRLGVCFFHFDLLDDRGRVVRPPERALPPLQCDLRDVETYERLLRRIVELHASEDPARQVAAARLLESVLLTLEGDATGPRRSDAQRLREARIAEVMRHIREHPGELFNVAEMAERASYAVDHFTRVFQEIAGVSPKEFCIRARIERARHLLRDSGMTVGDVASALGYADVFFFSRQFKARTGLTPTEWRQGLRPAATRR